MEAMKHRKETKIRHTGRGVSLDKIGKSKSVRLLRGAQVRLGQAFRARDASTPVIRLDAGRTSGICCVVCSCVAWIGF